MTWVQPKKDQRENGVKTNGRRRGYEEEADRGGYRMPNVGLCRPGWMYDPPFQRQPRLVAQA